METLAFRSYNQKDLRFLALIPCPVKVPFHGAFSDFLGQEWKGNPPFHHLIESNANNQLENYKHGGSLQPAQRYAASAPLTGHER